MQNTFTIGCLFVCAALASCSKTDRPATVIQATPQPAADSNKPGVDACSLLTAEEIQSVQGDTLQDAKASTPSETAFRISQCYFAVATPVNSVVVTVTERSHSAGAREPKEYWADTFHGEKPGEREEEEKEKKPPLKVDGIGDEAYWMGNAVGGALYVLQGNSFIRVSVGGATEGTSKLDKSKTLAAIALKRL